MANIDVEKLVKDNQKNMVTTTQLRLLLSNAVIVKNKIEIEGKDTLSDKLQAEVKYLLIKHIYQCGREPRVKEFDKNFKISDELKQIGNSVKKFNEFYRYLEEIVAYVKYYIG
ncbi:type III-A CRISPR-associated protein Csm2 [Fusobacterium sp.]|uniref:type III-A CRISPR-associated protein Csm2 n=1 Tax=Fusobacterium sp. TaxID=68766 RepID=UPI0025C313E9|nr:type III-A CRISPR-associated protein Csm2 [Fusobacterium sp.]MCI7223608.1 type III-A CRISPR-associated protein Csm2 [Fusobacterium sp.]